MQKSESMFPDTELFFRACCALFFAFVEKPDSPSVMIIKIRFVESLFARNLQRHENTLFLFNVRPCFVL